MRRKSLECMQFGPGLLERMPDCAETNGTGRADGARWRAAYSERRGTHPEKRWWKRYCEWQFRSSSSVVPFAEEAEALQKSAPVQRGRIAHLSPEPLWGIGGPFRMKVPADSHGVKGVHGGARRCAHCTSPPSSLRARRKLRGGPYPKESPAFRVNTK